MASFRKIPVLPSGLIVLGERELFLPFQKFPWFRDAPDAPAAKLVRVQRPSSHHLYWPDLDVDLAVESIEHPERFPLVSKVRSNSGLTPGFRGRPHAGAAEPARWTAQLLSHRRRPPRGLGAAPGETAYRS